MGVARLFGNLKVRPKLMVLHNLFFLVLTCAAYFSLIPLYEQLVADSHAREVTVLEQGARTPAAVQPEAQPQAQQQAQQTYRNELRQARLRLFLVLGVIYLLAVLLLESAIMPLY